LLALFQLSGTVHEVPLVRNILIRYAPFMGQKSMANKVRLAASKLGPRISISIQELHALESEIGRALPFAPDSAEGALGGPGYFVFENIQIVAVGTD
jgi:hypothetical protein